MSQTPTPEARFATAMGQLLGPDFPAKIALAVSGGGDSMAMLALAQNWARDWGVGLHVLTVDHGLRSESADEAEMVAAFSAEIDRPHTTLKWDWNGNGNVMDAARRARLDLIGRWCAGSRVAHVLMAHTSDDIAETFLLRLARGSGVEGLAAMAPRRRISESFEVIRPCLDISRQELRHYARTLLVPWVEDPTNDDRHYDRTRARQLMAALSDLGIDQGGLVATARRMARARMALQARLVNVAEQVVIEDRRGVLVIDRAGFDQIERDTQLRLLAAGCMWVASQEYRPRAQSLEALLDKVLAGGRGTLIGALAETGQQDIYVYRERAAMAAAPYAPGMTWDGRWQISGPTKSDLRIAPLAERLSAYPDWRELALPRAALMSTPALWRGDQMIEAPLLENDPTWQARIVLPFTTYLLSH